tara:strand:+ start:294 stop:509 length:216 start_codon:yes stop_codon:yes gene_type:complete
MQKFKIGELVTLSSAGSNRHHNCGFYTGFGIVVACNTCENYPYRMRWYNKKENGTFFSAKEYELKRYKVKK